MGMRAGTMKNRHIGSSFESFLEEEKLLGEVEALAQKRVFTWQIQEAMDETGMTKAALAERMNTSRTQVERLLDPDNDRVQLDTLQRAARAVGRTLRVQLV